MALKSSVSVIEALLYCCYTIIPAGNLGWCQSTLSWIRSSADHEVHSLVIGRRMTGIFGVEALDWSFNQKRVQLVPPN